MDFDVKYVAHLARIALTPEEEQKIGAQLSSVLGYIEKLKEVDVTGVEPTAHAFPLVNVTRPDEVKPSLSNEEALRNAPAIRQSIQWIILITENLRIGCVRFADDAPERVVAPPVSLTFAIDERQQFVRRESGAAR